MTMTPKQRAEAINACNRIIESNARLQQIAAEIQRGAAELRALWMPLQSDDITNVTFDEAGSSDEAYKHFSGEKHEQ